MLCGPLSRRTRLNCHSNDRQSTTRLQCGGHGSRVDRNLSGHLTNKARKARRLSGPFLCLRRSGFVRFALGERNESGTMFWFCSKTPRNGARLDCGKGPLPGQRGAHKIEWASSARAWRGIRGSDQRRLSPVPAGQAPLSRAIGDYIADDNGMICCCAVTVTWR